MADALALAGDLRIVISHLGRRMRQSHPVGLTVSQLATLSRLDREGPATVTALAIAEGVRPQSLGANISALEEAGFVRRSADSADARKSIISLTPAAVEFIRDDREAREDWLFRAVCSRLTCRERKALSKSLELMSRLIQP